MATIAFVKFKGVDALMAERGADEVANALDDIVSTTQRAAMEEGVVFLASDIDEDGGKLILDTYSHVNPAHSQRMAQLMTDAEAQNVISLRGADAA